MTCFAMSWLIGLSVLFVERQSLHLHSGFASIMPPLDTWWQFDRFHRFIFCLPYTRCLHYLFLWIHEISITLVNDGADSPSNISIDEIEEEQHYDSKNYEHITSPFWEGDGCHFTWIALWHSTNTFVFLLFVSKKATQLFLGIPIVIYFNYITIQSLLEP